MQAGAAGGQPPVAPEHAAALRHALLPLNGLRVISTVLIMVFHHLRLRRHFGAKELNEAFRRRPGPIHAILQGWYGLDVLFLMCGFLAALSLVPLLTDRRRSVKKAVLLYYWRRAARIVPAHWVSLLVAYFLMLRDRQWAEAVPEAAGSLMHYPAQHCPGGLWLQAAFLGHWQMGGGCSLQLWSQGTQGALWAVLPLLLAAIRPQQAGLRRRFAIGAGVIILLSIAWRVFAVWHADLVLPIAAFGSHVDEAENANFRLYQYWLHYPLLGRAACLAIGCLLALPFLNPSIVQGNRQREDSSEDVAASSGNGQNGSSGGDAAPHISIMPPMAAVLGAGLAFSVLQKLVMTLVFKPAGDPSWPREESRWYLVTMVQGGPLTAVAIAFMMAVTMSQAGPAGRVLHMLLSARFFKPLADLSYSAYLYHEQTRFWLWRFGVLPSGLAKSADDMGAFAIDMGVTLPATFAVAYISYRLIERPAASAARRLEPYFLAVLRDPLAPPQQTAARQKRHENAQACHVAVLPLQR